MLSDLIEVKDLDPTPVEQKVAQFLKEAHALEIKENDDYQYAAEILMQEKTVYKFVENFYKPTKDAMNTAKAELMKNIRAHTEPLDLAEGIIKKKMGFWDEVQEEKRIKEERRILAELETKEEDRRLDEAVETGDESILEEPIIVPMPRVQGTPKVKGISYRDNYKCKLVDIAKVPLAYLMFNKEKAEKMANATKGTISIEGVKIWKEKIIAARSR